ncbi:hypothetical protein L6R49_29590 [Myxococcota bacterium]|nr:hypothetical protein [Myxococcota bacterium]
MTPARAAALACVGAASLGGCRADLLPGELVLPGELSAVTVEGPAGLGEALAVNDTAALISAGEEAWLVDWSGDLVSSWALGGEIGALWWAEDGAVMAGVRGRGVVRVEDDTLLLDHPEARVFAGDAGGWACADAAGVMRDDGRRVELGGVRALALRGDRLIALACDGVDGCGAFDLSAAPDAAPTRLGEAGEGGAVSLDEDGVAWWSDPMLGVGDAAGVVTAEDGRSFGGLAGDQLGRSLSPAVAVGVSNPVSSPRRARALQLGDPGAPVIALVGGSPDRPARSASSGDALALATPERPGPDGVDGAVYLVRLDLPPFGP